ncbi:MAG: hypothetical protein LDL41_02170 [Coleofasciculus sp. S288]|nr:hypothetical protein [Coleofasciculus sp. S288]
MLTQSYQVCLQTIQSLYSRSKWVVILLLLALCVSCSSQEAPDVELKLSVQAAGRPGLYSVTGNTNLPNQSQITVAALRYLRPTSDEFLSSNSDASYSILDRQIARVENGKWQATLNLWQVAPDGQLQEAWQLNQSQTGVSLDPSPEVSFLAIFDPQGQLPTSGQQQVSVQELQGSLVRFTNEGQSYVRASQTQRIALPSGRRPPPVLRAEEINDGWGKRYELEPEPGVASTIRPQPIKTKQSNAPLSPSEILR